jgi:hypothetical protein
MLDVTNPANPRTLTEYWTALPARNLFGIDRFLTAFTVSDFFYPHPPAQNDQVIQLCQ